MDTENEFEEVEIERRILIKQNSKTGKLDLNIKLMYFEDLQDLCIEKGKLPKRIVGKINIEVLE